MIKITTEITIEIDGKEVKLLLEDAKELYAKLGTILNTPTTLPYIPTYPIVPTYPVFPIEPTYPTAPTTPWYTSPSTGDPIPDPTYIISCYSTNN